MAYTGPLLVGTVLFVAVFVTVLWLLTWPAIHDPRV